MSAKWRALQHKHRYTYSAVIFPQKFIDSLNSLPAEVSSFKFYEELKQLVSLNSTYAQVNYVKNVASAFSDLLLDGEEGVVCCAAKFYLEILFLENSLPLHRTLISVLGKNKKFCSVVSDCFRNLCDEYSGDEGKEKRFCLSRVSLSLMSSPKLGYIVGVVEECGVLVAWDIVRGLSGVISEIDEWSRPSPVVTEQCQEALSCMYYLLQRFPSKFTQSGELKDDDSNVMLMVIEVLLKVLNSSAFSRDCLVAAGVALCAALQVCLDPQELNIFIMECVLNQVTCDSTAGEKTMCEEVIKRVPYKGDLFSELKRFSALSRLCLIRGILTAVSRNVLNTELSSLNNTCVSQDNGGRSVQTILSDGILPELCNYCENPYDSHFNFHSLTVMQICLQQIKASRQANLIPQNYDPIPENMGTRLLKIIWNNLEDPLSQTVKQVHLIFDIFLDVHTDLRWAKGSDNVKLFLKNIANELLRLGPRCKGRYVPLASLTRRLGSKTILKMCPDLLYQTTQSYIDDDICCAATSFLKCFLECLRDECWRSDGIDGGYSSFRRHCLPPVLFGLAAGASKLRTNLNTYTVPVLLEVDVDCIFPMLSFISVVTDDNKEQQLYPELSDVALSLTVEQKVAVLVSLLKVSRSLQLMEGDIDLCESFSTRNKDLLNDLNAFIFIKGVKFLVPVEWLVLALTHVEDSIRVDAAETLFMNPKTSSVPSRLELRLMKAAIPLNMRCSSTGFQMKWTSLFRKFFPRVRTALERQVKQGRWKPTVVQIDNMLSSTDMNGGYVNSADDLFHFMKWLSSFLFFSCYPSAPYERKIMAMELMLIMIDVWSVISISKEIHVSTPECTLYPYNEGLTMPSSILLLVGSIVDSWDRLRENSFRILLRFPAPLPGVSSNVMVQDLMKWAKKLVISPRVRESDAGALTLRLLFRKYVLDLGWTVRTSDTACLPSAVETSNGSFKDLNSKFPLINYINSMISWLNVVVEEGEKDLPEACKNSFVHGVLLALRYTFEEIYWNSNVVLSSVFEMRQALEKLLELIMRITTLALWVVSSDAWYLPDDMEEMADDDSFLVEALPEANGSKCPDNQSNSSGHIKDAKPSDQTVMVGCWLAMKEVSLLLGTIIRKIPLPTGTSPDLSSSVGYSSLSDDHIVMLDFKQLEMIGNHFLEVLLKMKHNGAIDKTRAGFTALCNRLLCSNDPKLCKLTEMWMEQLMQRTTAKGQVVDDLLRRSAGIPAAFIALFLSEPEGTPKKLLPRALRWLLDVVGFSLAPSKATSMSPKTDNEAIAKIRDEGVVPTVHAFNVLRATFNDANLATDTSSFSAEAVIMAIQSFSSSYWEIRNSACQAYTSLVKRMVGFLNIQKRESARRSITGLEFFHRYPSLHPFLLSELKIATEFHRDGIPSDFSLTKAVHPSLCPMLILLSRLKPSTITSEAGDPLDPFIFLPFIRNCSNQSNLKVRVLASRALNGLVSNEKLPIVLLSIVSELPCIRDQETVSSVCTSYNSIHGALLQISSLLENNCSNLVDFRKKDQIMGDLIEALSARDWIGRPQYCPCPLLNASFLKVLELMLAIVRTCENSKHMCSVRNLLMDLSNTCLDVKASGYSYYDSTISELCKQATISYLSCVFQASAIRLNGIRLPGSKSQIPVTKETLASLNGVQDKLILLMSDPIYEVRLATLKWLYSILLVMDSDYKTSELANEDMEHFDRWVRSSVQSTILEILENEKYHKCIYYTLRILFIWNSRQFTEYEDHSCVEQSQSHVGAMGFDSVIKLWYKLTSMYQITRHVKVCEILICCLGVCIKRISSLYAEEILLRAIQVSDERRTPSYQTIQTQCHECIVYFVKLIQRHSAPSEPITVRRAVAESLIASGLLKQAEVIGSYVHNAISFDTLTLDCKSVDPADVYAHEIMTIWFIGIKLLEDEDLELRQNLAVRIQQIISRKVLKGILDIGVVPIQVEKVIEQSFEFLSTVFGHWIEYLDYLLDSVLDAANYVALEGDLVRRVFDKEIDNHHEEKLLISQICCLHLEKLPLLQSWKACSFDKQSVSKYLLGWREKFLNQLVFIAKYHSDRLGSVGWVGGIGNHKDAFLPLYANLLGYYALSKCILDGKFTDAESMAFQDIDLKDTLSNFIGNPMISNLYALIIKMHEKNAGSLDALKLQKQLEGCSIWNDFDPYFLLR